MIRIAAASNMQFVLTELTKTFEAQTNSKVEVILASSGKLTAQIKEGAPFDIFLSADMKYPNLLFEEGLTSAAPKEYAKGQLVLWSGKKRDRMNIKTIVTADIAHIALANPINAPYGRAAMEFLKHYDLDQSLKDKLVFGESIAQVNQFVSTGAAQLGFTAKSVVMSPKLSDFGSWINLDPETYTPVQQGIVLIKNKEKSNSEAQAFYNFLFTEQAQRILKDFGYLGIDKQ